MSDLREDVARAIWNGDNNLHSEDPVPFDSAESEYRDDYMAEMADAAIAVVFDRLIAWAEGMAERNELAMKLNDGQWYDLPDALRSKKAEVLGHE